MGDVIKEGYKITVTDEEGTVLGDIELGGYNLDKPIARSVLVDDIKDALPSEAFDPLGQGDNPMPSDHELLLHFGIEEVGSPSLILDEARARATPCSCFKYKERDYCWTKGGIGLLKPEQQATYCVAGKAYKEQPKLVERYTRFAEAAEEAHKKIETMPKGRERLEVWLTEMGRELSKRGIEV